MPEPLIPGMRPQRDADVEACARAIFCQRCDIAQADLESCLEGNAILSMEFDALMDEIANDGLTDDEPDCCVPNIFMDMHDAGLVNPRPIKLLPRGHAVRIFNVFEPPTYGEMP